MPGDLALRGSLVIPESELSWRFSRSSGPGGQSVNTADSRVELSWDLGRSTVLGPTLKTRALERLANRLVDGVLTVAASEHRSQFQNRRAAEAPRRDRPRSDRTAAPPAPSHQAVPWLDRTPAHREEEPEPGQEAAPLLRRIALTPDLYASRRAGF